MLPGGRMLNDEQNAAGDVLGKYLAAVIVDPASVWQLFVEKPANCWASKKST